MRYFNHRVFGDFEAPKHMKSNRVKDLVENYNKRLEFEKYMCPKGLKPTITSNFEKPQQEIEFVNHEFMLLRSTKDPKSKKMMMFRISPFLSKNEIA